MTSEEQRLYNIYAGWTGSLHHYCVKYLGAELNVEFFPAPEWHMKLYPGPLEEIPPMMAGTRMVSSVPRLYRPKADPFPLPRPEENPTQEELDRVFRDLCLAAAQVLQVDLGKRKLANGMGPSDTAASRRRLDES
jgi:hypothetical protein